VVRGRQVRRLLDDQDGADGPIFGRRAAAELLRRMLAAGLSRYEPDPIAALEAAERVRDA
jgi:hypothetical protein